MSAQTTLTVNKFASKSKKFVCLGLGILTAAAIMPANKAEAIQAGQTFTVTNTNDSGPGSLRQAIICANADSANAVDVINFNLSKGATSRSGIVQSQTITLTSALDITAKNLTINGIGSNLLTISGNNKLQDFTIESGANVTISGLTIAQGRSTFGGGILNNGTLTLTNDTLSYNTATNDGGGIYTNGSLTINSSIFSNNTAAGFGGGISNNGTVKIAKSAFNNNTAAYGGGIASSGTVTVDGSMFNQNTAYIGGGIVNVSSATLSVTNSTFTLNSASGGTGGGISNNDTSKLTISNSNFSLNSAGYGGGIFNNDGGGATLNAVGLTFSRNTATQAPGTPTNNKNIDGVSNQITVDSLLDTNDTNLTTGHISLRDAIRVVAPDGIIKFASNLNGGTITLTLGELVLNQNVTIQGPAGNLTISANNQSRVFNINSGANVTITGLIVTNGCSKDYGGGIKNDGTLTLDHDTISSSTATLGGGGIFNDGTLTVGNSLITHDTGGNGGGLLNVNGTSNAIAIVNGSSFTFDTSPNGYGGGISNSSMTLAVGSSHFSNNSAAFGGGGLFNNGMTTLSIVDFTLNTSNGYGSAILSSPSGNVNYTQVTFSGNQSPISADVFGPFTPLPIPVQTPTPAPIK